MFFYRQPSPAQEEEISEDRISPLTGIDAGASATKWAHINNSGILMSGKELAMDGVIYWAMKVQVIG